MKKINITFWWVFWILFLEIIYKIFVLNNFFNVNTITTIIFSSIWIIILSILCNLFNDKINKILTIILSFGCLVISLAQITYYNFYTSIFSFYSLTTGTGQVFHFWLAILEVILRIWYIFAIIIGVFAVFLIFRNKIFKYNNIKKELLLSGIGSLLLIFVCTIINSNDMYSIKKLIFNTHAPVLTINKIGLFSMEVIDVNRFIFGFTESTNNIISNNKKNNDGYNVINIDFDSLIDNESDKNIVDMHKYFKYQEPTNKNEYTGLFKNKNLIFITAESFDSIAIDKEITPTLYNMANNSFVFNNYYQPLFPISTSDGEYMNLNSLIPKEGEWSFYKTSNISMPFGLGNMFNKVGYKSYAFHNHEYNFYHRELSHPNIGFKYLGCGNGLEKTINCSNWPNSDVELIKGTTNYYINDNKPFVTYYMTVSGHLNYVKNTNYVVDKNYSRVENLKYSNKIKAYYSTQKELDDALNLLLSELKKFNKLDDTLIIISPDHYPYGLTKREMNEVSSIDRNDKFENYHTSLIIYNPNIKKKEINKVVSSIDILPTIYNLYGIEYDSRFLIGTDIFSDSEGLVILSDRSWITSKGKYNSLTKKFVGEKVNQEYINKINEIVNAKFKISSLILEKDYYSKLGLK